VQVQKPALVQEQKLKMNPQLYQSIQLMALPVQELKFRIQQELENNPALQVVEDRSSVSLEEVTDVPADRDIYEYFENTSDSGYQGYDDEAGEAKRRFMEGALSRPESLEEHLLWQLRLQPISERDFEVGELLIRNLDANGFHLEAPQSLVRAEEEERLHRLMEMIRTFEPVGTCVRDYKESLIVQSRLSHGAPEGTEEIIAYHLEKLERGKTAETARAAGMTEEQVRECLSFIRTLTPFPGRLFSSDQPTYVVPDLLVTMREGQFVIILNDEEMPVLGIDPFFERVEKEGGDGSRFARSSSREARWFIRSVQQRNQTLLKVARAIVEFQRDFFLRGPKHLIPLTLKDIANEIGVHEATVSRITTGKYMQTEWGIFELKHFFSNSISGAGSNGSRFSKEGVKEILKEILAEEGDGRHLSDQKLSDLLKKRGINIARRTVAKYRQELDVGSSYDR